MIRIDLATELRNHLSAELPVTKFCVEIFRMFSVI